MDNIAGQAMILLNVVMASILGGLIGLEREMSHKPAGLRTHITVAAATCLIINLGMVMIQLYNTPGLSPDPIRLFEAIVVGVSFIGGGVIYRDVKSGNVENLTTAASILLTATIGISVALKQYFLAGGIVFLDLIIMYLLKQAEKRLIKDYFKQYE